MVNCLPFLICYFGSLRNVYRTFAWKRNGWWCKLSIRILCCLHSMQFVKCVFSAKIWLVKISTRIVKYKSRVVKSNPVLQWSMIMFCSTWTKAFIIWATFISIVVIFSQSSYSFSFFTNLMPSVPVISSYLSVKHACFYRECTLVSKKMFSQPICFQNLDPAFS